MLSYPLKPNVSNWTKISFVKNKNFIKLQIHHYVIYHMPVNTSKGFTSTNLHFCSFKRSYIPQYVHKMLDCDSVLFLFTLAYVISIKFGKVGKTMPMLHDFTKLHSHEVLRKLHALHRRKLRLEWGTYSRGSSDSSHTSYLVCTVSQPWNLLTTWRGTGYAAWRSTPFGNVDVYT